MAKRKPDELDRIIDFASASEDEKAKELLAIQQRLAKAEKRARAAEDSRKHAERLLDEQAESFERFKASRFSFPTGKKGKSKKGDFCRFVIPDTHGCHIHKEAAAAMLADLEQINPAEIVMLGDHLECGGFLAQHQTLGYVAETEYSFEDDCVAANVLLDEIQRRAPNAAIDYLEGNHEHRIEKWIVTQTLRHTRDATRLRTMYGVDAQLDLTKRGIKFHELYAFHDGLPVQGAIRRGKCCFVHGVSHAKHAAARHLELFGGCVVFGHIHRIQSHAGDTVGAGAIAAWSPGCLCKMQPYYLHGKPSGWAHGYGLQLVRASGEFLHINVPILGGKSFLIQLMASTA